MNKAKFLSYLQERIGMLDDAEQKDILDEYSQHIDMKIANGMTESEAIDDFGPIDDLIGEILGAYHVKVPAVSAPASGLDDLKKASASAAEKATAAIKSGTRKTTEAFSAALGKMKSAGRRVENTAVGAGAMGAGVAAAGAAGLGATAPLGHTTATPSPLQSLSRGSRRAGAWLWRACKALLRWTLVACLVLIAAFFAFCGLMSMFGLGVGAVLTTQGYPFVGIAIALLGSSMAFFALVGLCACPIARKRGASHE